MSAVDPEAVEIAAGLHLDDATVLEALQDYVKTELLKAASEENGGATAHFTAEAESIWDDAVRLSFERWLNSRKVEG